MHQRDSSAKCGAHARRLRVPTLAPIPTPFPAVGCACRCITAGCPQAEQLAQAWRPGKIKDQTYRVCIAKRRHKDQHVTLFQLGDWHAPGSKPGSSDGGGGAPAAAHGCAAAAGAQHSAPHALTAAMQDAGTDARACAAAAVQSLLHGAATAPAVGAAGPPAKRAFQLDDPNPALQLDDPKRARFSSVLQHPCQPPPGASPYHDAQRISAPQQYPSQQQAPSWRLHLHSLHDSPGACSAQFWQGPQASVPSSAAVVSERVCMHVVNRLEHMHAVLVRS